MKSSRPHKRNLNYNGDSGYAWEGEEETLGFISFGQPEEVVMPKGLLLSSHIFGRPLSWYFRYAWFITLIFTLGEMGIIYLQLNLPLAWPDYYFWIVLGIWRIIMMVLPAEYVLAKKKASLTQAQVTSILSSFLAGFLIAGWQFFCYVSSWEKWQILSKPFIFAFFAWLIVYWWQRISLTNK